MNTATLWTREEDTLLQELYSRSGPAGCAAVLGRSSCAVQSRASVLGLKRPKNVGHIKLSATQREEIVAAYESGESVQAIIDRLGLAVKPDCVYKMLKTAGIKRSKTGERNRRWTDAEELAIVADYGAGLTQPQIAAKWGSYPGVISNVLKRRGVQTRHQERVFTTAETETIVARYKAGETSDEIAKSCGVFHKRILMIARAHGVRIRSPKRRRWTDSRGRVFRFRSLWELNVAQKLDEVGLIWDYEAKRYPVIVDGKRRHYTPDFSIFDTDDNVVLLIEVKGEWRNDQRRRIELLMEQNPDIHVEVWDRRVIADMGLFERIGAHYKADSERPDAVNTEEA